MKRILPHVVYLVIIGTLIVFANIKAKEAAQNHLRAEQNLQEAEQNLKEAEKQHEMAEMMEEIAEKRAAEAMREKIRADQLMQALQSCKGK